MPSIELITLCTRPNASADAMNATTSRSSAALKRCANHTGSERQRGGVEFVVKCVQRRTAGWKLDLFLISLLTLFPRAGLHPLVPVARPVPDVLHQHGAAGVHSRHVGRLPRAAPRGPTCSPGRRLLSSARQRAPRRVAAALDEQRHRRRQPGIAADGVLRRRVPGGDLSTFVVPIEVLCGYFFLVIALAMVGPGQQLGRALKRVPNRSRPTRSNLRQPRRDRPVRRLLVPRAAAALVVRLVRADRYCTSCGRRTPRGVASRWPLAARRVLALDRRRTSGLVRPGAARRLVALLPHRLLPDRGRLIDTST